MVMRSNGQIVAIRQNYQAIFGEDMEGAIKSAYSGGMEKLYSGIARGLRDETGQFTNIDEDVTALYSSLNGKLFGIEGIFCFKLRKRVFPACDH